MQFKQLRSLLAQAKDDESNEISLLQAYLSQFSQETDKAILLSDCFRAYIR